MDEEWERGREIERERISSFSLLSNPIRNISEPLKAPNALNALKALKAERASSRLDIMSVLERFYLCGPKVGQLELWRS